MAPQRDDARPHEAPYLSVHAVNVYVHSQEKSLRFYLDQLGFILAFDTRVQSGRRWVAVAPPDGSTVLSLMEPYPESKEYQLIGRSTGIVFVTEDVLAKYHEWRERGVRFLNVPRLRRVRFDLKSAPTSPAPDEPVWGG